MISIYTNPIFHEHHTGAGHPESASRLDAAMNGVERAGLAAQINGDAAFHPHTDRIIAKVHSADYERSLEQASAAGLRDFISGDNPMSSQTFSAARAAVGIALTAAEEMINGEDHRAFVVARPPGHHAERLQPMGFCFFNTIACVAEWMREQAGIERVFVFDFDVHHGNGTQALFWDRDDVFYASIHRFPFYPGTGATGEIGGGPGRGYTLNMPLEQGLGDGAYLRGVEDVIVRAIDAYQPQAILLSSGFDAHRRDPMGGMSVTEQAYGEITMRIREAAARHSHGQVLSLLEGGYDMEGLTASVSQHVHALA